MTERDKSILNYLKKNHKILGAKTGLLKSTVRGK